MNITAKVSILTQPSNLQLLPEPVPSIIVQHVNGESYLSVNGFIALPITAISSEYNRANSLPIFDPTGTNMGYLVFTKSIYIFDIAGLGEEQLLIYLTEIDLTSTSIGSDYQFANDYLVIDASNLNMYLTKYFITAPLWGRFCHLSLTAVPHKNPSPYIKAFDADFTKSTFADITINQAVNQYFPPERFLKFYHVLEADFDYIIADKLRTISPSASSTLGELVNAFGKSEYERLVYILDERITDLTLLVTQLDLIVYHKVKAETIFYTFTKPTNPLKDVASFQLLCSRGGFSIANFSGVSGINISGPLNYRTFIIKLTAYWIYRIRCCIAHKKIGEYIIQPNDEVLLVEFAEPLIREIIRQYLN